MPRRKAGTIMGGSALLTTFLLHLVVGPGLGLSFGAMTSLLACLVRGGANWTGLEAFGKQPFALWFSRAILIYPVCGIIAGLLCAALWFSMRQERADTSPETEA